MKPRAVYVDVDDTLIRYEGTQRTPVPAVMARVKALHAAGETLHLWSSGGAEYARTVAVELGLVDCFVAFLPKPEMYIDDLPAHDWINCEHSLPSSSDDY